jgi:hypothetical protein
MYILVKKEKYTFCFIFEMKTNIVVFKGFRDFYQNAFFIIQGWPLKDLASIYGIHIC